ncbi:MAG: hypothetical protein U9R08_03025 [Nanoarchaeota archaeon]|nr:hypothetical protein [Nanoarchaeota archaeon]
MHELTTFEEILKEQYILTDQEVRSNPGNDGWYHNVLFDSQHYSNIDAEKLEDVLASIIKNVVWISQSNVYVVEGVINEISHFAGCIQNSLHYLNSKERWIQKKNSKKEKRNYSDPEQKRLLEDITFKYKEFLRIAQKSSFKPEDPDAYLEFKNKIKIISSLTDSKIDYSRGDRPKKKIAETDSDEQIVAAALFMSIFEQKPCAIVTKDSDLRRILENSCYILKNGFLLPYEQESLINNPVRIYFVTPRQDVLKTADTSSEKSTQYTTNIPESTKTKILQQIS